MLQLWIPALGLVRLPLGLAHRRPISGEVKLGNTLVFHRQCISCRRDFVMGDTNAVAANIHFLLRKTHNEYDWSSGRNLRMPGAIAGLNSGVNG
jgi:hypothetical protein